ncbi:alcohol dehydrogenase catalytic domain-containing protein [Desulfovibrio sp. OttesenSCG-928-O18]|nr:alcohol dehydrogenase catalytic domain-containing protein [Desulfovibrio sp. OttesenSCG-928-O18]
MKAILKTKPERGATVADIPEPERGEEPILKMDAASICGSDVHVYEWSGGYDGFMNLPLVIGHEGCGRVVYPGASKLKEGQRILVDPGAACGECSYCRTGRDNICPTRKILGLHRNGLFAEYAAVPAANCIPLPDSIPDEVAASLESLGVAVRAMENAAPVIGDSAAIVGPGPLGLMSVLLCKMAGLAPVFVFGTRQDEGLRMDLAEKLGADGVFYSEDPESVNAMRKASGGHGVDHVFEWSGSVPGLSMACSLAKPGGKVVIGAIYGRNADLDVTGLVRREVNLVTVRSRPRGTWLRTLNMVAGGTVDITPIIGKSFSLDQAEEAFTLAAEKKMLKGVFRM